LSPLVVFYTLSKLDLSFFIGFKNHARLVSLKPRYWFLETGLTSRKRVCSTIRHSTLLFPCITVPHVGELLYSFAHMSLVLYMCFDTCINMCLTTCNRCIHLTLCHWFFSCVSMCWNVAWYVYWHASYHSRDRLYSPALMSLILSLVLYMCLLVTCVWTCILKRILKHVWKRFA